MGTHLRVLSESFPMNTNITWFRWFSKMLHPCALGESSLSIGRVKGRRFWSKSEEDLALPEPGLPAGKARAVTQASNSVKGHVDV